MRVTEAWRPFVGGAITTGLCLGGTLALGTRGGYESLRLLEAAIPTIRFVCSSLITASATILALMLTLLGLSLNTDRPLAKSHYLRVRRIARWDAIGFLASLLFLLLLSLPLQESDQVPRGWFDVIYYAVLSISSLLAGYLSVVVLLLYEMISDLIEVFGLEQEDHPLLDSEEVERSAE